jgi:hypothetical protein
LSLDVIIIIIIIIIMDLQAFVEPWPLFQFLKHIHSRQDSLDGGSAAIKLIKRCGTSEEQGTSLYDLHGGGYENYSLSLAVSWYVIRCNLLDVFLSFGGTR